MYCFFKINNMETKITAFKTPRADEFANAVDFCVFK